MHYYILTGASRGLGLGLATQIAARGDALIAISRQQSPQLAALGQGLPNYRFIQLDLADAAAVSQQAATLMGELAEQTMTGIYLINNAGMIEPIAPAGRYSDQALLTCLQVNLNSPIALCNAFVAQFGQRAIDRRILNISSGAGRNPYQGWSAYCASKAGLDMYSRCLGMEQAQSLGIRVAALAPGIIDSDMQATIRSHSSEDFLLIEQFKNYATEGELVNAQQCAQEIMALLHSEHIGYGSILNIRDFR